MIKLTKRLDKIMLVLPAAIFLILFSIYPLLFSFRLIFYKWFLNKPNPPSFVGLNNIQNVLLDARFWNSFKVTVTILIVAVAIETLAGLFLSLLFRDRVYGKRIIISLLMIPIMISPMVIGIILRFILNPEIGIANYI